jgi:hypothetical protein
MNYRSHRHDDCCESSEPRCQPPISWPQRPSLPNFPGIATFWPMPFAVPMWPSMGSWGGMRSGCEPPEYSHRRHDMYLYRCCEPRYGRHAQCCERCGEYDCRCERRCERCGEYDCRCERRCERCGRKDCRCGGYGRTRAVKLIVETAGTRYDYAISIDRECFDSSVLLRATDLVGDTPAHIIPAPVIHSLQDTVEIIVVLDAKPKIVADNYSAKIYDRNKPAVVVPIAHLTLNVFS